MNHVYPPLQGASSTLHQVQGANVVGSQPIGLGFNTSKPYQRNVSSHWSGRLPPPLQNHTRGTYLRIGPDAPHPPLHSSPSHKPLQNVQNIQKCTIGVLTPPSGHRHHRMYKKCTKYTTFTKYTKYTIGVLDAHRAIGTTEYTKMYNIYKIYKNVQNIQKYTKMYKHVQNIQLGCWKPIGP